MSDPLRHDPSRALEPVSEAERDAKIEQLLLAGLDHYFAAHYEQAINVWTRALFFDRSHARARAYIERARSAQAERQRESEELLQSGLAAFGSGDTGTARRLLRLAIEQGAPADEALAVLSRINRLEPGLEGIARGGSADDFGQSFAATQPPPRRLRGRLAIGLLLVALAAGGLLLSRPGRSQLAALLNLGPASPVVQLAPPFTETAPELPRRGEMALDLARTLTAGGRLRDALVELDRVRDTDPERADADRLRAEVQKQLIALAGLPPATEPDATLPHQP